MNGDKVERVLLGRMAEAPTDTTVLWLAYWGKGGDENIPKNIEDIASDLINADKSRTVLVHGRYGSGKSSFLEALRKKIECDSFVIWVDMASITSQITSTALAAVMYKIADFLQNDASNNRIDALDFISRAEDLWQLEAGCLGCESQSYIIPPEANRMAGARGEGGRAIFANTLESEFDRYLISLGEMSGKKHRLTVFLDDLDRCERRVGLDVVRLLLRCSSTKRINFVLASDWDVLEQGVRDWMGAHGKADNGEPLVTANSALEKYIHTAVELPGMGELSVNSQAWADGWLVDLLSYDFEGGEIEKNDQPPILAEILASELMQIILREGEHE